MEIHINNNITNNVPIQIPFKLETSQSERLAIDEVVKSVIIII
jgi:hypothetical protein